MGGFYSYGDLQRELDSIKEINKRQDEEIARQGRLLKQLLDRGNNTVEEYEDWYPEIRQINPNISRVDT